MRIIEALRNSDGNMTRAASRLGLKRTTLQSKMKQLGKTTRNQQESPQVPLNVTGIDSAIVSAESSQTPAALMGNAGAGRGS
jgi:transposase-like protein